jgi:hypothetical protein
MGHADTVEGAPWSETDDLVGLFKNAGKKDRFTFSVLQLIRRLHKITIFKKFIKVSQY